MPQKLLNTMSQTAINHYNQFRSVRTESLRWLKIATDTVNKIKFETESKEKIPETIGLHYN